MSKKRKIIIIGAIASTMSIGAIAGVTIPLVSQSQNNISSNVSNNENNYQSEYKNLNNGVIESSRLNFKAKNTEFKNSKSINFNSLKKTEDKITGFESKKLYTVSGNQKDFLISTLYKSERKYMPILEYDDQYVGNNRLPIDVEKGIYPGWNKEVVLVTSNVISKPGIEKSFLKPNKILKDAYKIDENKSISQLIIDGSMLSDNKDIAKRDVENAIKHTQPDFLVLKANQNSFDKLPMDLVSLYTTKGKSLKKLQIYGDVTDIKKLQMPSSLEEIEFYAPNLRSIDPLQIPENANLVYDNFISSNFTSIDLSDHNNLSKDDFQKAINVVYQSRINDRYFQNHWAGGYIAHWNLRNTGIYSFNGMNIPELKDGTGRFYIASVEIETDQTSGPSKNEQIESGSTPSNDSQIGEWFDWNEKGWSQINKIVITSKDNAKVDFDKAINEVIGFLNKYPNINEIDISALEFTNSKKTHDNFVDTLKTKYNAERITSINFIKKESTKKN